MARVAGKVALVTGAARGIGAAVARLLASEGASVLLTDIDRAGLRAQNAAINAETPERADYSVHDVTSVEAWQDALRRVRERFGGLDILVNNAGIATVGNIEETTPETWRQLHAVNLDGVFLGCKLAIPLMRAGGGGSIVNISSISGVIAGHNLAAYNSAKAAVTHLSKSVALHCARQRNNIRCNAVHPAFIDTALLDDLTGGGNRNATIEKLARQIPLGRIGSTADVAAAVLYLAADESSFVTGSELRVDGGISAM